MKTSTFIGISDLDLEYIKKNSLNELLSSTKWKRFSSEVLVSYDPVTPETRRLEGIRIGNLPKEDFIILAVLAQVEDSLLSFLLKVELEKKFRQTTGLEDFVFLTSGVWQEYLKSCSRFNQRYLRGLFSKKSLKDFMKRFQVKIQYPKTSKPTKVHRHKGYRDKGTLPNPSTIARRQELQKEFRLTELQNQLENYQNWIDFYLDIHLSYLRSKGSQSDRRNSERRIFYVTTGEDFVESSDSRKSKNKETEYRKTDFNLGKKNLESREQSFQSEISIRLRSE